MIMTKQTVGNTWALISSGSFTNEHESSKKKTESHVSEPPKTVS